MPSPSGVTLTSSEEFGPILSKNGVVVTWKVPVWLPGSKTKLWVPSIPPTISGYVMPPGDWITSADVWKPKKRAKTKVRPALVTCWRIRCMGPPNVSADFPTEPQVAQCDGQFSHGTRRLGENHAPSNGGNFAAERRGKAQPEV